MTNVCIKYQTFIKYFLAMNWHIIFIYIESLNVNIDKPRANSQSKVQAQAKKVREAY